MRARMKQTDAILSYLKEYPYITQLIARHVLGIERLASRISDLKQMGAAFDKEYRRDVSGRRYMRYYLKGRRG